MDICEYTWTHLMHVNILCEHARIPDRCLMDSQYTDMVYSVARLLKYQMQPQLVALASFGSRAVFSVNQYTFRARIGIRIQIDKIMDISLTEAATKFPKMIFYRNSLLRLEIFDHLSRVQWSYMTMAIHRQILCFLSITFQPQI